MKSAALFDLDGTVMDTPAAIVASLVEMTASFGVTHPEPVLRAQIGRPLDSIVDTLLPEVDRAYCTDDFGDDLAGSFREALSHGVDGWVDDDLAFARPWRNSCFSNSISPAGWNGTGRARSA